MANKHLSDQLFADFDLYPSLQKGLVDAGFEYATPIQALTLPIALKGQDVAGQAQTGTGKTIAFLLPTFQRLMDVQKTQKAAEKLVEANNEASTEDQPDQNEVAGTDQTTDASADSDSATEATEKPKPKAAPKKAHKRAVSGTPIGALILAPTRELAIQIHKDAVLLSKHTGLKLGLAYGGTGYQEQRDTISNGIDILIGTPGRIIDYYKQGVFTLDQIQVAVMDEADRMFDLGFVKDIRYLLRRMPDSEQRLNLMFSATMSFKVDELAYEHMNSPEAVEVKAEKVVNRITEIAYYPAQDEKIPLLIHLLKTAEGLERALVFVNTKHEANKISDWLLANEFKTSTLSGDVPQDKRERLLQAFHDGKTDIMVATDVAARGLHIPNISHVFNYDLPQDPEDYVHRSGRTARAGASGHAISLACEKYAYGLTDIEQYIGHSLPIGPITTEMVAKPKHRPAKRAPKKEWSRTGGQRSGGTRTDAQAKTQGNNPKSSSAQHKEKPQQHTQSSDSEQNQSNPDRPEYKDLSQPRRDIEFIPVPEQFSQRFGEVPMIG